VGDRPFVATARPDLSPKRRLGIWTAIIPASSSTRAIPDAYAQGDPKISREGLPESPTVSPSLATQSVIDTAKMRHETRLRTPASSSIREHTMLFIPPTGSAKPLLRRLTWNKLAKCCPRKRGHWSATPSALPSKSTTIRDVLRQQQGLYQYSDDLIHWERNPDRHEIRPDGLALEPCVAITISHPANGHVVLFIAGRLNGKKIWYYAIWKLFFHGGSHTKSPSLTIAFSSRAANL